MAAKIQIQGLREFQAALKQMDTGLPKQLRVALNEASGLVVDYAAARMPKKTGRAAASLKARSTQRVARVGLGGRRAPYAPWLVYGGEGRIKGRPSKRPFIKGGRDFGPYGALVHRRPEIIEVMSNALAQLAREAGLEVSG